MGRLKYMNDSNAPNYTTLPPLTDEFLFQIIFCMEDQANSYYIDLKRQDICEQVFIEERIEEEPDRFLPLPEWIPSDGFHTMEKFVSTLRNPIYRERLRKVLQLGKGVFRQFKDVVHEQPSIEKMWYYFKDKEMRHRVYEWYELHTNAFALASLHIQGPETETLDVIKEDFIISEDFEGLKDEYRQFCEMCLNTYNNLETIYRPLMTAEIEKKWEIGEHDHVLFALSNEKEVAGILVYFIAPSSNVVVVKAYYIKEEFRGIGLFHLLFDTLCEKMNNRGIDDLILDLYEESLPLETMFKEITTKNIKKSVYLSISSWIDSIK